jgi:IclR family pca regulon transcriptional regulator
MELREIATPHLQELSDLTGHTVNMAILDTTDIVDIERVRSAQVGQREVDLNLHIGSRLPAYGSSMGKLLLANLPGERQRAWIEDLVARLAPSLQSTAAEISARIGYRPAAV